jgi:hypothetical protein
VSLKLVGVPRGSYSVRRQSCETARKKDNFVVPEVVGAEFGLGATELASPRRELLGEVSFLPLNGRILELARLLVVPGASPDKAAQMQRILPQRQWKSVNFYLSGTSGISRTFVFAGRWRGFLRTMATPKRPSIRRKSLSDQKPWEVEVLQEVYAVRDSYAAEHGYNLDQIYADLTRREASSDLRWSDSRPLAEA